MNEHDFRREYESLQHQVHASSDLKQRTLAAARASARPASAQPHRRADRRSPQTGGAAVVRRWGLPVAACLVTVAIAAGGVPVVMGALDADGHTAISLSDAQQASGFSVRAYAADGSGMLELGNDGTVVFDRNMSAGMPAGDYYQTEGYFTGCLFRIEGDGVARVQMNVSRGELYRFTSERFTRSEEPEKWDEALRWKPTKRGTGTYFGEYDAVQPISENDGLPKESPDKSVGVDLSKRLGSTIDVSAKDDPGIVSGETSFGLWTNEQYGSGTDPFSAAIDLFDDQTLTVTVTFEDGHTSTQVIELHAADFRAEHNGNETIIIPEQVDRSQLAEDEAYAHSLYGTVIEANKEAFPLPLDNANELANDLLPTMTLERNEETQPTGRTIGEDGLVGEGGTINAATLIGYSHDTVPIEVGYPTLTRSALPPDGKAPAEFSGVIYAFRGDFAYMNKCSNEVFGYGFDDDGSLTNDDYSYVTATFDVTNASGEDAKVSPNSIAEFGVLGSDGSVSYASTSYDLDFSASDNALPCDEPQQIGIAAGDTVRITILRVLPNHLIDDEGLLLIPAGSVDGSIVRAFSIGGQL